jgi:hypothetical protein
MATSLHYALSLYLCQDVLVEVSLKGTHFNTKDAFTLGRKRRQNVTLETPEHEGLELFVKFLNLLFVVDVSQIKLVRQGNLCRCVNI